MVTKHVPNSKPITQAENRAEITGILNTVEHDAKLIFYFFRRVFFDRNLCQSDYFGEGFEVGNSSHFNFVDLYRVV